METNLLDGKTNLLNIRNKKIKKLYFDGWAVSDPLPLYQRDGLPAKGPETFEANKKQTVHSYSCSCGGVHLSQMALVPKRGRKKGCDFSASTGNK